MGRQVFAVTPAPASSRWWLWGLFALPLLILAFVHGSIPHGSRMQALPGLAIALLVTVAVFGWIAWSLRRQQVALEGGTLTVQAAMFGRRVAATDIDIAHARIVDLREHTGLRPAFKLWGMGLPGFDAGWFLCADKARRFCLLTLRERVLHLPLHAGKPGLLLSLQQPRSLLDALAGAGPRR